MANEVELDRYLSLQPLEERTPPDFEKNLEELWVKHFGMGNIDNAFARHHLKYPENKHLFYIAQEYLFKSGLVSQVRGLEDLAKPFRGVSVCAVGGVEGRAMAEMGAFAVNIDPMIGYAPKINLPNLQEIALPLDTALAKRYTGRFDMVLSSGLIDSESGFTEGVPRSLLRKYCRDFLLLMLTLLKPSGLAILRGDLVHLALNQVSKLANIRDILPFTEKDRIKSPDVIFVIQKNGNS